MPNIPNIGPMVLTSVEAWLEHYRQRAAQALKDFDGMSSPTIFYSDKFILFDQLQSFKERLGNKVFQKALSAIRKAGSNDSISCSVNFTPQYLGTVRSMNDVAIPDTISADDKAVLVLITLTLSRNEKGA